MAMLFSLADPTAPKRGPAAALAGMGLALVGHGLVIAALLLIAVGVVEPPKHEVHAVSVRFLETPPRPPTPVSVPVPPPPAPPPPVKVTPPPTAVTPPPKPVIKPNIVATARRTSVPDKAVVVPPSAEPAPPAPPATPVVVAAPPPPVITEARFDAAYLDNPKPVYPAIARRLGETGRVLLRVRVGADGSALEVVLKTSSGSPRLDESAQEAVSRWKFVPARQGDTPIESWVIVPIVFSVTQG